MAFSRPARIVIDQRHMPETAAVCSQLLVRHLNRNQNPVHPSESYWMLGEMPSRVHLTLTIAGAGFAAERGLPIADNDVSYDF